MTQQLCKIDGWLKLTTNSSLNRILVHLVFYYLYENKKYASSTSMKSVVTDVGESMMA